MKHSLLETVIHLKPYTELQTIREQIRKKSDPFPSENVASLHMSGTPNNDKGTEGFPLHRTQTLTWLIPTTTNSCGWGRSRYKADRAP